MAIKKLTKKEIRELIDEKNPESRRTLLTHLAQETNIKCALRTILNGTNNPQEEGFSIGRYTEKRNGKREIILYSLNDSTNPLKQTVYCFVKTSKGYREWKNSQN